jgi:hypothetical protein
MSPLLHIRGAVQVSNLEQIFNLERLYSVLVLRSKVEVVANFAEAIQIGLPLVVATSAGDRWTSKRPSREAFEPGSPPSKR